MLLVKRLGKKVANAVALMLSVYLFVCLCVCLSWRKCSNSHWLTEKKMAAT